MKFSWEVKDRPVGTTLPLLELKDLTTVFPLRRGLVQAVDGLSFQLRRGEKLGVAGESGSGKSVSMLSILRLVPYPGKTVKGEVIFQGENLLEKPLAEMRRIRGKEIAMIFQDPMSTLNPVFRIGEQIRESLRIHGTVADEHGRSWPLNRARRKAERRRVIEALGEVGIPIPEEGHKRYPHEAADVRAAVSSDEGRTWGEERYIVSVGNGYPGSVVLDDDTIVTVCGHAHLDARGAPIGPWTLHAVQWRMLEKV